MSLNLDTLQQGNIGTTLTLVMKHDDSMVDLTGATNLKIFLERPDGRTLEKTGVLSATPTDGSVGYTTEAGDLDQVGKHLIQSTLTLPTAGNLSSDRHEFTVQPTLP